MAGQFVLYTHRDKSSGSTDWNPRSLFVRDSDYCDVKSFTLVHWPRQQRLAEYSWPVARLANRDRCNYCLVPDKIFPSGGANIAGWEPTDASPNIRPRGVHLR